MENKPTLKTMKNGPFILANLNQIKEFSDKIVKINPPVSLCRCGKSESKPNCDGTHYTIGFVDDRCEAKETKTRDYVGKNITIHDNRGICSHPGYCFMELPTVFDREKSPWINPDGDTVENIIETIKKCPSGALSYSIDGVHYGKFSDEPMIEIVKDGPYAVTGSIAFVDERQPVLKERYTLCRCGLSYNKPFCDGEHFRQGFKDK